MGGSPAKRIMSMERYAEKVLKQKNQLPWMQNAIYKSLSDKQLILERKKHYFLMLGKEI